MVDSIFNTLSAFAFYYPLFMAYVWMVGGAYYCFHWERIGSYTPDNPPPMKDYPGVTILLPCHNEGENLHDTIACIMRQQYPLFEVIAINDGSTDNTGEILDALESYYDNLRVIHLASNQGKAMALRMGAMLSLYEYLVCVDGDAMLSDHATTWMVKHLHESVRVGAVTGNPRIRNRSTLLGKLQVGEFSSIIGLIKRAQRIYGRVFTVSGVVVAFRKTALQRIGYWNCDMATEDIDVSWRLQLDHWDVRYEPNALCWILMPETLQGLWSQRVRWAQGGAETAKRYFPRMFKWKSRRMWPVLLEYIVSVVWSYCVAIILLLWLVSKFTALPEPFYVPTILPGWSGVTLGITCLLQFLLSLWIDSRYEKGLVKHFFWMIWYPLAYWMINVFTTVAGVPKALFKRRGQRAVWTSPDRGVH